MNHVDSTFLLFSGTCNNVSGRLYSLCAAKLDIDATIATIVFNFILAPKDQFAELASLEFVERRMFNPNSSSPNASS